MMESPLIKPAPPNLTRSSRGFVSDANFFSKRQIGEIEQNSLDQLLHLGLGTLGMRGEDEEEEGMTHGVAD